MKERKWWEETPSEATGWRKNERGGWQPPDEAIPVGGMELPEGAKLIPRAEWKRKRAAARLTRAQ